MRTAKGEVEARELGEDWVGNELEGFTHRTDGAADCRILPVEGFCLWRVEVRGSGGWQDRGKVYSRRELVTKARAITRVVLEGGSFETPSDAAVRARGLR